LYLLSAVLLAACSLKRAAVFGFSLWAFSCIVYLLEACGLKLTAVFGG